MASSPKPVNGNAPNNHHGPLGKRKKPRSKGSYLSKWLDKTMHHLQDATPSMDTYDSFIPNMNWPNTSQFAPGYDACRFNMYGCTPEPLSLPTLPTFYNPNHYYNPEFRYMQHKSVQVQRPRRRRSEHKAEEVHSTPNVTPNGTLNYFQPKNITDSQDYASLPPIVTSVGDTNSNSDMNTNEKDDSSNARRYSDPCVRGLPDVTRPTNGDIESGSEDSSDLSGSQVGPRLLTCLLDQITALKMANERLNKELMETRAELDNYRQQSVLYHKGSNSSVGNTPNHSPLNNNGMMGGQYGPGFVADVVREIREAARTREDALYARVRSMLIDRTDNSLASPEAKFAEKSLEEIKSSLRASEADKRRMMDRIVKMEDELRLLRIANGLESNLTNGNTEETDTERLRLRKEVLDMRKAKQNAEEHALKLERLVTQLRSKFNGLQISNGPDSLPSEPEHETRIRRSSVNSSSNLTNNSIHNLASSNHSTANSTVVFGPVTDL